MNLFKKQDGMTLIEILVSLTLLAVIITAFSGAFVNGMRSEREVRNRLEASNLASDIAETIEKHASNENSAVLSEIDQNSEYEYPFNNFSQSNNDIEKLKDELKNIVDEKSSIIEGFESASISNKGEVLSDGEKLENLYDFEISISWQGKNHKLNTRFYDNLSDKDDDDDYDDDYDDDDDDYDDDDDDDDEDDYDDDDEDEDEDYDDDDEDYDDDDDDRDRDDDDDDDENKKSNGRGNGRNKDKDRD